MKQRIGQAGYARMARALTDSALTIQDLPAAAKVGRTAARRFVSVLHELGHVYIESWIVEPKRSPKPLWRLGSYSDTPPPTVRCSGRPVSGVRNYSTSQRPVELVSWSKLLVRLQDGGTVAELSLWSGLYPTTVRRAIAALRREGVVHVCGWRTHAAGRPVAEYGWGNDPDIPRPKRSQTSIKRDYAARKRMRALTMALTGGVVVERLPLH
jgi:hypothetical protein